MISKWIVPGNVGKDRIVGRRFTRYMQAQLQKGKRTKIKNIIKLACSEIVATEECVRARHFLPIKKFCATNSQCYHRNVYLRV